MRRVVVRNIGRIESNHADRQLALRGDAGELLANPSAGKSLCSASHDAKASWPKVKAGIIESTKTIT